MRNGRVPFASLEERLLLYDDLPYLGLSRAAERRLLADLSVLALPDMQQAGLARDLARADTLAAGGKRLESLTEIARAYESGVKVYEGVVT